MGKADGGVHGVNWVVNNGPAEKRWNLAIVAEGYTAVELQQFDRDASTLAAKILQAAPFSSVRAAINVLRLDVESTHSGADDPACGGSGTGTMRDTYFDATFCRHGISRLLTVDRQLVKESLTSHLDTWHAALVLVNSTKFGGSGYHQVAVCSNHVDSAQIALHELGHSAFGLYDEYDGAGSGGRHPNIESGGCNVTISTVRKDVKWNAHILPTTAIPTEVNPACSQHWQPQAALAARPIGTYEGADNYDCGAFRPEAQCKMRALAEPFCTVCAEQIRNTLLPFIAP